MTQTTSADLRLTHMLQSHRDTHVLKKSSSISQHKLCDSVFGYPTTAHLLPLLTFKISTEPILMHFNQRKPFWKTSYGFCWLEADIGAVPPTALAGPKAIKPSQKSDSPDRHSDRQLLITFIKNRFWDGAAPYAKTPVFWIEFLVAE